MRPFVTIGNGHRPADYGAMSNGTVRYLSLEWIDALTREVAASSAMAAVANEHTVGITQTVTGGPEGDVTYHLQIADGVAAFGPGAAWPEDVRFETGMGHRRRRGHRHPQRPAGVHHRAHSSDG